MNSALITYSQLSLNIRDVKANYEHRYRREKMEGENSLLGLNICDVKAKYEHRYQREKMEDTTIRVENMTFLKLLRRYDNPCRNS